MTCRPCAALENAVKLDPGFVRAWQQLVQLYDRLNLTNEAYQARFTAANVLQTTAGPMLKLCWLDVGRTAWKSTARR